MLNLDSRKLIALGLCLLGIGFHFMSPDVFAFETLSGSGEAQGASIRLNSKDDRVVTKSRNRREKTNRRVYFPFRDPESLQVVVDNQIVLSAMDVFILESRERKAVLARRIYLREIETNWMNIGLGPKHPDVMTASEQIDRLEADIWDQWRADLRSADERMAGNGR